MRAMDRAVAPVGVGEAHRRSPPAVILDAGSEQFDGLGDASCPLRRVPFGGVDPAQVSPTVELRQPLEELASPWVAGQGGRHVVGEVAALRALGLDLKFDLVPGDDGTATQPCRAKQQTPQPVVSFDDAADPITVDGDAAWRSTPHWGRTAQGSIPCLARRRGRWL